MRDVKPWVPYVEILAHVNEPSDEQNYLQSYPAASLMIIVAL